MATTNKTMTDIFEQYKYDRTTLKNSETWYEQQILLLKNQVSSKVSSSSRITPNKLMVNDPDSLKNRITPGSLYMFFYDPKHKATLPYYDTFPLVFPYRAIPGGFMGLNMHYLPYQLRSRLLDGLLKFTNNTRMDKTTKLKFNWDLITSVAALAPAKACIKHYLSTHVMTQFKKIEIDHWPTAMMLPVERFVKARRERVWSDSLKKI